MKTFKVIFKSGVTIQIRARQFKVSPLKGLIEFYTDEHQADPEIHVVSSEVAAVVPEKSIS